MSHTIYPATGIVIARTVVGEANVILRLLTREYGVVSVMAQNGAASAKFAPACTLGSRGIYDIVRGKRIWRLTGVKSVEPLPFRSATEELYQFCRYIAAYTARFVNNDESPESGIYELVVRAVESLDTRVPDPDWIDSYRYKLLTLLGYIDDTEKPKSKQQMLQILVNAEIDANV
jgi:DNA repair protein RecO